MRHPLPGLSLALHDDLLDLGVGRAHQHLGAVEAHAPEDLDGLGEEPRVEDRLGQVEVAEVSRALGAVPGAGLAPGPPVDDALAGVHEAAQLGPAALVHLRVPDAPLGDRGAADLLRAEDAELDPAHGAHGRLGVPRVHVGHLVRPLPGFSRGLKANRSRPGSGGLQASPRTRRGL